MKKTYMTPTMVMVNVKSTEILAGSIDVSSDEYSGTVYSKESLFDFDGEE